MNRIDSLRGKKSLVIYLMAGDPDLKTTEALIYALDKAGVSLIELGIPFSDPVADGPAIQRAGERALKNNITIDKVLALVKKARKKVKVPIVFMTYYNLIYHYGHKEFIDNALIAGVDGVIIPDLPFDEEAGFYENARQRDFYIIYLAAPTNSKERIKKIVEKSRGFVYYILLKGVTGARAGLSADFRKAGFIRSISDKPVFAGFGVSKPVQARDVLKHTDGVIIGSAFVELIERHSRNQKQLLDSAAKFVKSFLKEVTGAEKKD